MTITDQVRAIIATQGNLGETAIARKLGVNKKAVGAAIHRIERGDHRRAYELNYSRQPLPAAKKLAYATAYYKALRAGFPVEVAREHGRIARAQVRV